MLSSWAEGGREDMAYRGMGRHKGAKGGTGRHQEAQGGTGSHREAQHGSGDDQDRAAGTCQEAQGPWRHGDPGREAQGTRWGGRGPDGGRPEACDAGIGRQRILVLVLHKGELES